MTQAHKIIHENIVYLPYMLNLADCDYSKDRTILISEQDFVVYSDHEPTYTKEELLQLNVSDLIIQPVK
jgi:hypothetical protein